MTLSTGAKVENSRVFARYEAELAVAQRANKARRVQALHAKIANTRKDFLHKETTSIADAFGLICVGNVSGRWLQATNGRSAADASTGGDVTQHAAVQGDGARSDVCGRVRIPHDSDLFRLR